MAKRRKLLKQITRRNGPTTTQPPRTARPVSPRSGARKVAAHQVRSSAEFPTPGHFRAQARKALKISSHRGLESH